MRIKQPMEKWTSDIDMRSWKKQRVSNKYMKRCSNKMCYIIHTMESYITLKMSVKQSCMCQAGWFTNMFSEKGKLNNNEYSIMPFI